jgi:hypothetical protein
MDPVPNYNILNNFCLILFICGIHPPKPEVCRRRSESASQGIFLIREKKQQPKAKSLPMQGSLRQLLRNVVVFCRFGVINRVSPNLLYTQTHLLSRGHGGNPQFFKLNGSLGRQHRLQELRRILLHLVDHLGINPGCGHISVSHHVGQGVQLRHRPVPTSPPNVSANGKRYRQLSGPGLPDSHLQCSGQLWRSYRRPGAPGPERRTSQAPLDRQHSP